ncbi:MULTISPECIES: hypothetical protein [unclassified Tolypothrix]|nr:MULTISPECIES: hypothetical protein [unclassified Tolypothrix]EKF04951.1 hypothetical protein FDUTEX481_01115 [Tolypothrix sp. PCC 7601]MBE9081292.1 hypothetical protein [Tolypothrix sp. LEGE 11397]UYD25888.1 hypothetical protein HGR01_31935 [Tolypothrix sp. PCC 7712]UYD31873.1 hypothetical protein HG267_22590 [Tolypothrix sp. PCC 7601]
MSNHFIITDYEEFLIYAGALTVNVQPCQQTEEHTRGIIHKRKSFL